MGSFQIDMEVRTPAVGNIIIPGPHIINRNSLLLDVNECVFVKVCFKCMYVCSKTFLHV